MGQSSVSLPSAGITIDENALYFVDILNTLYKLGTNGKGLQKVNIGRGATFGVPAVRGGLLAVGASTSGLTRGSAAVYVFNKETLLTVWTKPGLPWLPVLTFDDRCLYSVDLDKAQAFDSATGAEVWSTTIFGLSTYNPVILDDKLYFATGGIHRQDGYLYCLNKLTGEILFQVTMPYMQSRSQFGGSSAGIEIWRDYVYVPSHNRYFYCFNKANGAQVWTFLADSPMETPPRVADGIVYTGSLNRTCYAINPESGELVWSYQAHGSIGRTPPQFCKDVLFETTGALVILDKASGKLEAELTPLDGPYSYQTAIWHSDGTLYTTGRLKNNSDKHYLFAYRFD